MKHGSRRYKFTISNQFSVECSSYKWQTGELVTILYGFCWIFAISVKESICLCTLTLTEVCWKNFILKVLKKIPDIFTRIHSNCTYNDKLINHPLFQRYQMWYLGKNVSGSPCRCSGFLCPRCIQKKNLPLYVHVLLFLKEQRVLDIKAQILFVCSSRERYFKFIQ